MVKNAFSDAFQPNKVGSKMQKKKKYKKIIIDFLLWII